MSPALFLLPRIAFPVLGIFQLHVTFRIVFSWLLTSTFPKTARKSEDGVQLPTGLGSLSALSQPLPSPLRPMQLPPTIFLSFSFPCLPCLSYPYPTAEPPPPAPLGSGPHPGIYLPTLSPCHCQLPGLPWAQGQHPRALHLALPFFPAGEPTWALLSLLGCSSSLQPVLNCGVTQGFCHSE